MKSGGPIRVMVVDDHLVFAEALALAIEATGELTCEGTAPDVEQAAGLAQELEPDVAVMEVQLNGTDGVAATRLLRDRHPEMQVLVLTRVPLSHSLVRETIPSLRGHCFAVDRHSRTPSTGSPSRLAQPCPCCRAC